MSNKEVFVFTNATGWDETTRAHRALNWLETFTKEVEKQDWTSSPWSKYFTADSSYTKSDGTTITGGEKIWTSAEGLPGLYAPFSKVHFDPATTMIEKRRNRFYMIGAAGLNVSLHGQTKTHVIPSAYIFEWVESEGGLDGMALSSQKIFSDTGPVFIDMLKLGLIKA